MTLPFLVAAVVTAQTPQRDVAGAAAQPDVANVADVVGVAQRAAAAAEKAAQAAAIAAEAALKAAEAAARISSVVPTRIEVPAAPVPTPPAAKPAATWSGTVGLGLISLTGNSRTVTFNTNAAAERKTEDWILAAKLFATYGQNRAAGTEDTDTVAEAAGGTLRLDRRFGPRYSGYVLGGADTDHVKSVELRSTGEAGATVVWVDAGGDSGWKTSLRSDFGFRVAHERRFQYYPVRVGLEDETLYAPRTALAFRYALSKDVLFAEDAEIMTNVVGDSRVVVNSVSKVSTRLSRTLAFGVAFTVGHDSRPAPEKVSTDTSLALTLDVLL